jgi:hypothetical protein
MDHIGIDVHKRESQIYILAEGGEVIERRIRTEPERFAAVLGTRARARIVLEASTDSEWVARSLEALGHEVIVADPNFAPMYATRTRKVKTGLTGLVLDEREYESYRGFRSCHACRVPPVVPPPGIACASTRHSRRRARFPVKEFDRPGHRAMREWSTHP